MISNLLIIFALAEAWRRRTAFKENRTVLQYTVQPTHTFRNEQGRFVVSAIPP